jgi:hypothetical protein
MDYLTLFNNFDEFDTFIDEKNFEFPCVAYVQDENYVHYFKDYETLPTILIRNDYYPSVANFFRNIMEELDLDFSTNEYYRINLREDYTYNNEIDVTDYEWYDYLLSLETCERDYNTGECEQTWPVGLITICEDKINIGNNALLLVGHDLGNKDQFVGVPL